MSHLAFPTLVQALRHWAAEQPDRPAYTFLSEGGAVETTLDWRATDERVRALAAALQAAGRPGERVLLLFPPGLDFVLSFFACLYSGMVAIPAYPPRLGRASERERPDLRLRAILADAQPGIALTTLTVLSRLAAARAESPELGALRWLAVEDIPGSGAEAWQDPGIGPEALAFLQYTSGSTSTPKGVMVSHGNLVHNEEMIRCAYGHTRELVQLGWLPLYHDMGLIGNVLQPLYNGGRCVLMAPVEFLQRPLTWLQAITRFRATTSGAPNFAYDLCVRKIPPERREGLDLSSWNVAFNGAEPVQAATLERFAASFAPWGFRRDAFCPCYGLAEATLLVTGGRWGESARVAVLDETDPGAVRAVPQEREPGSTRQLVSSGRLWLDGRVVIADPSARVRRPEGVVGEIWVASPSVAGGYWNRPEETARTFDARLEGEDDGPFLRTGDLGFLLDGELFVTGRLKDLIILRGRNLYPQDVELTAEGAHPALRPGCGAAFSVDVDGEERLVLVQELERRQERAEVWEEAAAAVRQAVAEEHEVPVHDVVLVRAGTIPKTTSGKIQRHACRNGYLAGALTVIGRSVLAGEAAEEGEGAPALDREALLAQPEGEERRTALEAALRARIARLLRRPAAALEPARALTSLGLDSLSSVELAHEVESSLGVELSLADLLGGATLGELAGEIAAQLGRESAPPRDLRWQGSETDLRPCSYGQRGLWFLHRLDPGSVAYNIVGAARVRGELRAEVLERSFRALLSRHELLRATFEEAGGEPMVRISAEAQLDFRAEEALDGEEGARLERLADEGYAPFDLGRGPLLRVRLVSRSPREHLLLLAVHHAVADFWSLAVLLRELGALLEGGGDAALAPLPLRAADWMAWERQRLDGAEGERRLAFWREVLAGDPPALDLPADRPRPAAPRHRGGLARLRLDAGLTGRLDALGRGRGATRFMTLLAALQALLHRSTGQSDITVGTPVASRGAPELRPLVGYFVHVLVLRSGVDGAQPFTEVVDRARETALAALAHGEVPLPFLTERLRRARGGRSPFFQVMLALQQAHGQGEEALAAFAVREPGARLTLGGLQWEPLPLEPREAQHDLALHVAEMDGGLAAALEYDADLFDDTTAARLLEHLHRLLAGAVGAPERPIAEIPLLGEAEQAQVLVEWNDTAAGVPEELCLHELFEAQVRRTPAAEALVAEETRRTYEELSWRANQIAHFLRRLGIGPEERVGVAVRRSARLVESLFGVLKAGGAYVPLDPAYPAERLDFLIGDAAARVVLTEGADLAARLGASGARVIDLAAEEERIASEPVADLEPLARPGHLAYLIYTSGSTGRPKGVAIEHRSPVALAFWARKVLTPEELSGVLASTSVGFDLSVFEIFVPLAWGGRVILAENALALPSLGTAGEVRLINTVPSAMAELVRGGLPAGPFTVCLAGEPIGAPLAAALAADPRVRRSLNLYGPSEDTTYSTWAQLDPGAEGSPPIGRPLADTRVYLLDPEGRPVPIGVPGELYLAGAGLARGYLDRPDLTAERFVPDPFCGLAGQPGGRLYRTGDLARFRAGGVLDFLGRGDHQVKIRGFRIEPGEIEAALLAVPGLREAAVVPRRAPAGDLRLVAYVCTEEGAAAAPGALREHLRHTLPEHMLPAAFVALAALPRTPHGKLDRGRLPEPDWGGGTAGAEAPRTPTEEILAGLWASLLGLESVGVDDDFFERGGHSLLATRLLSGVRDLLGVDLPVSQLFEAPTVARLAARVDAARPGGEPPPLRRLERPEAPPLSFAQERLWFLHRLDPLSPAYNVPAAVRVRGPLDAGALREALGRLARRQEVLLTRFPTIDGRPVQWIESEAVPALELQDLTALPPERREAEAARRIAEEAAQPFDLASEIPLRGILLRLGADDHLLLLTLHHIAADEWSLAVFARELGALYGEAATGRPAGLPPLPVQYADFAVWQRQWLEGEALEPLREYWRGRLYAAPAVLDLPTDRARPARPSWRGGALPVELPAPLARQLRAFGRQRGATLFMTLLAGFQALLSRYSGQHDLVVGVPIAHRTRSEVEGLIGFFTNVLAVRAELEDGPGFGTFLESVRTATLGAYVHQDLPFEKLVEELRPERSASHAPLFQVVFQLHNAPPVSFGLPGLAVEVLPEEGNTAKFDLVVSLGETADGIAGTFKYSADLFDAATLERLSRHYGNLLEAALAEPERPLPEVGFLTETELGQLLREWNAAVPGPLPAGTLHGRFAARAAAAPEAEALVFEGTRLTYGELDRRANRLAHVLRRLGAGPEVQVGLCVERSVETVVGILGILKAGAAYLPLDPAYPRERLAFVLEDSGAPLVVTQSHLAHLAGEVRTLCLDGAPELAAAPEHAPPPAGDADHLAYVIHTSGSTGRSKGVGVTHGHVLRLFERTDDWYGFGPDDVWTLFHSYAFDFSVWELWGAFLYGGRLVMVPWEVSRSPADFLVLLAQEGVTVLNQTPSAFRQLVAAEGHLGSSRPELSLRWVVFGGEALDLASLAPWFERHGDERPRLVNMYGITETTVHVTWRPVGLADLRQPQRSVIGRTIPDLSLLLLDPLGSPVPVGVPGEMYVGGAGVARGYMNRPALTAERFVPDPFGSEPGARLYRSGDLARYLPDGDVEYLGRIDHQVKVRGFRIELGEIEAALAAHPAVGQAVAHALRDGGETRLVAYVVFRPGITASLPELREVVSARLPEHMVPEAFVKLETLPLTPTGKLDRRALPLPEEGRRVAGRTYVAPRTPLEEALCGVWQGVLAVEAAGLEDDFFELGGNSITAAVLTNRLQEMLGEIVHVVAVFDTSTVGEMAAWLERDYPRAVARLLGRESRTEAAAARPAVHLGAVDVARLRSLIRPLPPCPEAEDPSLPKNPRAVLVLSPPRCGSTLLRVMLGGHPELFAPPELELLSFNTLAERRAAFTGRDSFWLEGVLRAVMAARSCGLEEATELVAQAESAGWTARRFYGELQGWLGGRLLVDKTPSYSLDPEILRRAESYFEAPFYVHLVRHPHGMVRSFEEARLDQIFFRQEHPFSRRELAELLWIVSQQNVLDFLSGVPERRQILVRFEDLVRDPESVLRGVCHRLGIDYHPAMAQPYEDTSARMTDGVHAVSRMLGDVKFHGHGRVDARVADSWKRGLEEDFLGEVSWGLAEAFGYGRGEVQGVAAAGRPLLHPILPAHEDAPAPLSFAQERLWFLDQLHPGDASYNLAAAFRIGGDLCRGILESGLGEIVRRHAALRTTFRMEGERPVQVVAPDLAVPLPLVDLAALPPESRRAEMRRLADEEARRPFDLARGPLLRQSLVRLAGREHLLLFTMHHIVGDGWSVGLLARELGEIYRATLEARKPALPPLPVQYTDYARWERRWLPGPFLEQQLAYWRGRLAGVAPLELPADRPRPTVPGTRGDALPVELAPGLAAAVGYLARRRGTTLFTTLLTAFSTLLMRLSGQEDVTVGSPVAHRNRIEIEGLIGFFVNTLVLRSDLAGNPGFDVALERVRRITLDAYVHQDAPFEKLVEELAPERRSGRSPLFQASFALENAPREPLELPGVVLTPLEAATGTAKFDLSLVLREERGALQGFWELRTDLFDRSTIRRLQGHFETLLSAAVGDPGRRLWDLPLLSAAERHQMLEEWNDRAAEYPGERTLGELFRERVDAAPGAPAVLFGERVLSYRELDRRASRLAHRLRRLGVGVDCPVGVSLERSPELIVALLAVIQAGGAYVPLDPEYPPDRLAWMLANAGISVLVTRRSEAGRLPAAPEIEMVFLDELRDEEIPEGDAAPEAAALPESLAYVVYTSGSTGRPKGVAVSHRSVLRLVRGNDFAGDLGPDEVFLQIAPVAFDASTMEIWGPLLNGSCLAILPPGVPSLEELGRTIRRYQVSTLLLTAGLFHAMVDERPDDLRPVRQILAGGDVVSAARVRRLLELEGGPRLVHCYGPTENTTFSSTDRLTGPGEVGAALSIGRPIRNSRAYVVDAAFGPAPVGVAGELAVGGPGLARGYLGQPELTAERFVPDPFGTPGGRLYRTGDMARLLGDGRLEFLGRRDQQVKIRGFRIEPAEVEAALSAHPEVGEAIVLARPDAAGDRRLVAYVVGLDGAPAPGTDELRSFAAGRLPSYMVPSAFVALDALPLTPNGKVDRQALPEPAGEGAGGQTSTEPRTPAQRRIAAIFAELLGVARVGQEDDFFALGGHSLLATRVMSRLREAFGVELPLRALFDEPTVAGLARVLDAERRSAMQRRVPPLRRRAHGGDPPLSFAQQRLWFLDQLEPGSPAYNMPLPLRLRGPLRIEILEAVLSEIVRRHEALRTTFAARGGGPVQVIHPPAPFSLPLIDLERLGGPAREAEARRLLEQEILRPFDLVRGPLVRCPVVRLAEGDFLVLFAMHHIIGDGWSRGVVVRELAALHEAVVTGVPCRLPELPVQYADFAVWQRGWLCGEALESEIGFWRRRLEGAPALLELPLDRPRPAVPAQRGANLQAELAPSLLDGLEELGRREGCTRFMALLAVFQTLLLRWSGQEDLLVGSPVANRHRLEIEPLVGFFVNTLALRGDLAGEPSFRELLGRTRDTVLEAQEHQDLPFERLVEELRPERSLSHAPLVQVMFSLEEETIDALSLPELTVEPLPLKTAPAKVDLVVMLAERAGGLAATFQYRPDLFDGTTIRRLQRQLETLLRAAVEEPERRLSELPLLGDGERHQLVAEWNDTASDWPRGLSLAGLFALQAARTPSAPAVEFAGEVLSYAELDRRSGRLAHHLRSLGVGPEVRVGLCLHRSAAMVVATLAVVKAGGAYVPLDPSYPRERLELMLADAGIAALVTVGDVLPGAGGLGVPVIDLEDSNGRLPADLPEPLADRAGPDSLAYVIYTSGSTGRPKGIAIPQRGVIRLVCATDYVRLGPGDRIAQASNTSFDAATFEIWGALLRGGTVVGIGREVTLAPRALAAALRELRIDTLFLTTALFNQVAREEPAAFATLREVLFGGEAVDPQWVRAVLAAGPPRRLLHVYGPTESTTFSSWHRIAEVSPEARTVPIGLPIASTTIHVVDRALAPVPPGVAGELVIGGDGLARGYLGLREQTAERFVPDPFGTPGGRLYRTGDLVRRLGDGAIEFLGRFDHQVKIRGFRIELPEIEGALAAHPAVAEAVVVVREDVPGDRRLVAYLVAQAGMTLAADELREHLRHRLPSFMVPAAFVTLEALPLNVNGKVDRRALPEPETAVPPASAPPRTLAEELLAGIFAEVLGLTRVGVDDDFFVLGGHSLLATQAVSRIREAFGVELPLRELFESPTVAALARAVEQGRAVPLPPVERAARDGALPLSFAQQRLWFLHQLEPGSPRYNVPLALRVEGEVDAGALASALSEIVRRHEALRTVFRMDGPSPVQEVLPAGAVPLPVADLTALGVARREAEALRLATEEARRPFDLERGPVLRAGLVRLAAGSHRLLLTLHHIASDGWSLGVLLRELQALYPRLVPLPELRVQYPDFAVWQRRAFTGEILEAELAFWRGHLGGAPPALELPRDRPRPAAASLRGAVRSREIDIRLTGDLRRLGRNQKTTLFMTLLAAFQALLSRVTGQTDVAVGTAVAGRDRREVEPLIGFFVNTLVLRADLGGEPGFADVLGRLRPAVLAAFAHQDLPFDRLVEDLQPERSLASAPLIQVMFALQSVPLGQLRLGDARLEPLPVATGTAKLDLSFTLLEQERGLSGAIEYSTDLFDGTTVDRLLGHFEALLSAVVADPGLRIGELPLLSAPERHQLAVELNATDAVYPRDSSLAGLFAEQAARAPGAPAVEFDGEVLSYAELDARSNRLAHHLRELGVGPEVPVGLCLERSAAMVVATLAIVKAGGAYVPLDPSYPRERLELMLADAGAAVLVTAGAVLPGAGRLDVPVVDLDCDAAMLAVGPESAPGPLAGPDHLAYVVYTSGSTGRPKGIGIPQRGVVRLVCGTDYVRLGPGDRIAQASNTSFDAATFEIWGALLRGGTVVGIGRDVSLAPRELAAALRELRVDTLFLTTALFNQVAREEPAAFSSLREVLFGGEAVDPQWVRAVLAAGPPRRLLHVYGPTESTTFSSWYRIAGVPDGAWTIPIGGPVGHTTIHVVDRRLDPVPLGVAGELVIGGDGLARGYVRRPELTAERFVPDPFGHLGRPGGRLYRTGDLVRRQADGAIEFLGRFDHQVKIRGFRIELAEIEVALAGHPAVAEAVVLAREDAPGDRRLVAYVVGVDGGAVAMEELRSFLRDRLPAFMVPAAFVVLDALPLNVNGKVDRRALPAPEADAADGGKAYVAPRTELEEMLAGIFAEVLGREQVGVFDDFFNLGGHSLLAMQAAARIREVFEEVSLRDLFGNATVAALAARIEEIFATEIESLSEDEVRSELLVGEDG